MIFKRLLRFSIASAFARALTQKSSRWLSVGLGLVLLRFFDRRASKAGERAKRKSA